MEDLVRVALSFVVMATLWHLVALVYRSIKVIWKAAEDTIFGEEPFAKNLANGFATLGPIEGRMESMALGNKDRGELAYSIEVKGRLPINGSRRLAFVTSILDATDEIPLMVISTDEKRQESETIAFQHLSPLGTVSSGDGFVDWKRVSAVIPENLVPPQSGQRKLAVILRLVDIDNMPEIDCGFVDKIKDTGTLWETALIFEYFYPHFGYGGPSNPHFVN